MVNSLSDTKTVLGLSAAIFALYFPCALWINADYEANRRPIPGGIAVHLGYFAPIQLEGLPDELRAKNRQFFQTVFRWTEGPPPEDGVADPHFRVYENNISLGSPIIEYVPYSKQYALSFYTSDNSDPRRNGRDYWIVRQSMKADNN